MILLDAITASMAYYLALNFSPALSPLEVSGYALGEWMVAFNPEALGRKFNIRMRKDSLRIDSQGNFFVPGSPMMFQSALLEQEFDVNDGAGRYMAMTGLATIEQNEISFRLTDARRESGDIGLFSYWEDVPGQRPEVPSLDSDFARRYGAKYCYRQVRTRGNASFYGCDFWVLDRDNQDAKLLYGCLKQQLTDELLAGEAVYANYSRTKASLREKLQDLIDATRPILEVSRLAIRFRDDWMELPEVVLRGDKDKDGKLKGSIIQLPEALPLRQPSTILPYTPMGVRLAYRHAFQISLQYAAATEGYNQNPDVKNYIDNAWKDIIASK